MGNARRDRVQAPPGGLCAGKIYNNPTDPNSKEAGTQATTGSAGAIQFNKQRSETVYRGEDGMFRLELRKILDYSFLASQGELSQQRRLSLP